MSEFQSERFQDLAPQQTGLIHEQDKVRASEDIRTIQLTNRDGSMAVITPVENNSELNQLYFDSSDAYYVSSIIELDTDSLHTVAEFIRDSPSKRKIVLEYSQLRSGKSPEMLMSDLSNLSGRQLEIDQNAIDAFNNTIAGVTHFYSPVNRNHEPALPAGSMIEAFDVVVANGVWNEVQKRGVEYINGPDITDDVLSDLWDVYNDTFDVLVDNHPSAQKQLKADFLAQCIKPNSHITYVKDKDEIVSALFLIDDARELSLIHI